MPELLKDKSKKYVVCEIFFFRLWWQEQSETTKLAYRQLIKDGQVEFVGAGVSQNDEATVYYTDAIDNMTWGHQFIKQEFGAEFLPKVGWQLDPFGHTLMQPHMFSEMGFNAWFFARLDEQDKQHRMENQTMEHLQVTPRAQNIFSHAMKQHYCSPPNTEFDIRFNDPAVDSKNVKKIADQLVKYLQEFRGYYQQDTIMHNIGCDFTYSDRLISYINADASYNTTLKYSTPSEYIQKIHSMNLNYTKKNDDFLPYANNDESYWTGFFTSRPVFKE